MEYLRNDALSEQFQRNITRDVSPPIVEPLPPPPEDPSKFDILVDSGRYGIHPIHVSHGNSVGYLKHQLSEMCQFSRNMIFLYYKEEPLEDNTFLGDYGLSPQCRVLMYVE